MIYDELNMLANEKILLNSLIPDNIHTPGDFNPYSGPCIRPPIHLEEWPQSEGGGTLIMLNIEIYIIREVPLMAGLKLEGSLKTEGS